VSFDRPHQITDRIDLIGDDVCHREARDLILYRDYYFEAIKPVGSEIVAEARLVRHARSIDTEMSGYDLADLAVYVDLHGRSSLRCRESESTHAVSPEGLLAAIKNNNVRYLTEAACHRIGHASTAFLKWPAAPPAEMGWPFASRLLGRPLALGRRHNVLRGKKERGKERACARNAEQENNHPDSLTRRCGLGIDVFFHDDWHVDSSLIGFTLADFVDAIVLCKSSERLSASRLKYRACAPRIRNYLRPD
jgi:hypothetical protein